METKEDKSRQQLRLKRGRTLGFAVYGEPAGEPVFYFHGWPSSRIEGQLLDRVCSETHLCLIAPDRPGYGLSGFQEGRRLLDWPLDVAELADAMGVRRFAILGVSGGGPYALACGATLADRITALLLVGSVGLFDDPKSTEGMVVINRMLVALARRTPWIADRLGWLLLRAMWGKGLQPIPESIEKRLPAADKVALQRTEVREILIRSSAEALRKGTRAAAQDGLLLTRPWGFPLGQISLPVQLWHGERDVIVPPAMGRSLVRALRECRSKFYPDDGHFSLPCNRAAEILGQARTGSAE